MNFKKFFSIKNILKNIDDQQEGYKNFYFDLFLISIIVFSSVIFVLNTFTFSGNLPNFLIFLNYLIMAIFTFEFFLRNYVIFKNKENFFSIFNIIDFVAIFPFWFFAGTSLYFLRVFRILKIFRFFAKYSTQKYFKKSTNNQIIVFKIFSVIFILLFISSCLIYTFEKDANPDINNFTDALYLSLVTVTTVGFGDIVPQTQGGRLAVMFSIMAGIFTIPIYLTLLLKDFIQGKNKVLTKCKKCGLKRHDENAVYCKMCGEGIYQEIDN